jgi:hypothetical protein
LPALFVLARFDQIRSVGADRNIGLLAAFLSSTPHLILRFASTSKSHFSAVHLTTTADTFEYRQLLTLLPLNCDLRAKSKIQKQLHFDCLLIRFSNATTPLNAL